MAELHLEAPMTREPAKNVSADQELWRETLTRGHAGLRGLCRVMRLLPGTPRCKICNNPFGGIGGRVCRVVGFTRSRVPEDARRPSCSPATRRAHPESRA